MNPNRNRKPKASSQPRSSAKRAPVMVEDMGRQNATTSWFMAVLLLGGAVAIVIAAPMKWIFDVNDPEFNPLVLITPGMGLVGLGMAGKALWQGRLARRFGKSVMHVTGNGVPSLGQVMEGVVRTEKPVLGEGVVQVTLSCVDTHEFRDRDLRSGKEFTHHDFIVWESRAEVPMAGLESVEQGIPFRFETPDKVGEQEPKPVDKNKPFFKFKGALMIPGMKHRIWAGGEKPVARNWRLEVRAAASEGFFKVAFEVPVEQH